MSFSEVIYGSWKKYKRQGYLRPCTHPWFPSVYWSHSCRRPVHVHAALPSSLRPGLTFSWVPAPGAFALVTGACSAHMWKKGQKCQRINTPHPMLPHSPGGITLSICSPPPPGFPSRIALQLPTVITCLITHHWLAACLLFITFLFLLEFLGTASQINHYRCINPYLRDWFQGNPN